MKIFLLFTLFISHLFATNNHIHYFEQKSILTPLNIKEEIFSPLSSKESNFGYTKSIFWLKVILDNNEQSSSKQVVYFPYTLLDYIDIYEFDNQELILKREMGDLRKYLNDGFLTEPSFFVNLKPFEKKILFIKVQTQGSMNIDLNILEYEEYIKYGIKKSQIFMFYFGAVLIMLMYNFIIFLYIRDYSYLYYIVFHLDFLLFSLAFNGFTFAYFWPSLPELNNFAVPIFMSIGSTFAVIFTIDFLNVSASSLKLYRYFKYLVWVNVVSTLLVFLLSYRDITLIISILSIVSVLSILSYTIYSHFILKNKNARFFALAWSFLLLGIFVVNAKNLGLLPTNEFTSYAAFIGAFIELILLSSALAYRYKLQNEEIVQKDIALYRQSRLAGMGEMVANIAHQWRQPLHRISLSLSVIESILKTDNIDKIMIDKKIKSSEENLQYMSNTINDFTNYFRVDKIKQKFNIYESIQNAISLLDSRTKDIEFYIIKNKDIFLDGFKNEYLQVLLVILNNAVDNFELNKIKNKKIKILINSDDKSIWVEIKDNAGGITQENIEKIFDPYFTTKFKEEAIGIGLYMAKMLIEESMHGKLSASSDSAGATFRIEIRDKITE